MFLLEGGKLFSKVIIELWPCSSKLYWPIKSIDGTWIIQDMKVVHLVWVFEPCTCACHCKFAQLRHRLCVNCMFILHVQGNVRDVLLLLNIMAECKQNINCQLNSQIRQNSPEFELKLWEFTNRQWPNNNLGVNMVC